MDAKDAGLARLKTPAAKSALTATPSALTPEDQRRAGRPDRREAVRLGGRRPGEA